jgi:hypothetical protein
MSTNGSPQKTTNMAPSGALFGSPQRPENNVGASDNNAGNTPSKDTQFRQHPNQIHPPLGNSYPPSQPPFPGDESYLPSWQGYDFSQGGYGGHQMFPHQQLAGQGQSSPGVPRVPPEPAGNHLVNRATSFSSTLYEQIPGAPGRPPISLPMKRFQPAAEPRRTDVAGIVDLPPLPDNSYHEFDRDAESNDSSDLGVAEGKAPISLKQTEFSLKQFAKGWGSPTLVPSTSGRKYGWLGVSRRCIGLLSRDRIV